MIKSMTGFASLTHENEHATIAVSVKTVNHRFLDLQLRLSQTVADLEPRIRAAGPAARVARPRGRERLGAAADASGPDRRAERGVHRRAGLGPGGGARHRPGVGPAEPRRPAADAAGARGPRAQPGPGRAGRRRSLGGGGGCAGPGAAGDGRDAIARRRSPAYRPGVAPPGSWRSGRASERGGRAGPRRRGDAAARARARVAPGCAGGRDAGGAGSGPRRPPAPTSPKR